MVNMILRDPHEGATMFAKLVNVIFLQNPPAEAHRNRIGYLKQRLCSETQRAAGQGRRARILNLGCGPAKEVELFLEEDVSDQAEMLLLDFNAETLEYASRRLNRQSDLHGRRVSLEFKERSIHQLHKDSLRRDSNSDRRYDFIYCAGLFDYVSDRVCRQLTKLFCNMLAPGGVLLVTNVDASKPFRHSMEYLLDWHLIYRTPEQMLALAPETDTELLSSDVFTDSTAVNLFLEVRKPSADRSA
jgi:extracellular factor (EF) 3-hydroxypalmitic acid methyl ester biosynthesis protein